MIELKPRRVRIVEKNMKGYTGYIGGVHFTDGVSDETLSYVDYMRIGANISVVDWEAKSERALLTPAAEASENRTMTTSDKRVSEFDDGTVFDPSRYEKPVVRTRKEIEDIADKEGLPGVRDIARIWGRTGRSISDCITAILAAQDEYLAKQSAEELKKRLAESPAKLDTPIEEALDVETPVSPEETAAEEIVSEELHEREDATEEVKEADEE